MITAIIYTWRSELGSDDAGHNAAATPTLGQYTRLLWLNLKRDAGAIANTSTSQQDSLVVVAVKNAAAGHRKHTSESAWLAGTGYCRKCEEKGLGLVAVIRSVGRVVMWQEGLKGGEGGSENGLWCCSVSGAGLGQNDIDVVGHASRVPLLGMFVSSTPLRSSISS